MKIRVITASLLLGFFSYQCKISAQDRWNTHPHVPPTNLSSLKSFTYLDILSDPNNQASDPKNQDFSHNTYPFDLPASDITTGTIHLSSAVSFTDHNNVLKLELKKTMRCDGLNQIIITNFPDISSLSILKDSLDHDDDESIGFGLHFFGVLRADRDLDNIKNLLDNNNWGHDRSQAFCRHLDFAISSPGNNAAVDLTDSPQRERVLTKILEIVNSPGATKLETLSLRFMHL